MSLNFVPVSVRNPKLCPIEPVTRKTGSSEFITLRKYDVYISDAFWARMGYPDYLQFAIDLDEKVIGMKVTDEKDPYAVKINMQQSGGCKGTGISKIVNMVCEILPFKMNFENENVTFYRSFKFDNTWHCFKADCAEKKVKKHKKRGKDETF